DDGAVQVDSDKRRVPPRPEGHAEPVVIHPGEAADVHLGPAGPWVDLHVVVGEGRGPEGPGTEPVAACGTYRWAEARVKIMDLGRGRRKGARTLKDFNYVLGDRAV